MMMGDHRTSCTFTTQQISRWVVTHSKADSNLHGLSLGFVDSLYEPALEPFIRTLGSSRISSMAYQ